MLIMYKNFEIKMDEHSYDLYQIRPPKKIPKHKNVGSEVKVCLGYFTSFERLIQKMIQVELSNKEEIMDLRSYLEFYRDISDDIKEAITIP